MDPLTITAGATAVAGAASSLANAKIGGTTLSDILVKGWQMTERFSLSDVSKAAQVNPLTIVDDNLRHLEQLKDILQSSCSIYSAYYLQAFHFVHSIKAIKTLRVLDQLNPNRDNRLLSPVAVSSEAFADSGRPRMLGEPTVSLEASDNVKTIYENNNLAVGKILLLNVDENVSTELTTPETRVTTSTKDGLGTQDVTNQSVTRTENRANKATIPVVIRLTPAMVPSETISHIFAFGSKDNSFKERYFLWKAGQIRFFKDLCFNVDQNDRHRRILATDDSGLYQRMIDARNKNSVAALRTGRVSLGEGSSIAILSKATVKRFEREITGRLSSFRVRERLFSQCLLLLIYVVDEDNERVTIYHRGIEDPTTARFSEIVNSEKGKGPDIMDILSTYIKASAPTL